MVILDLCGGTGAWSKPYADAGYEVINVTLPELDVLTFTPPNYVHGILAAPPCTMFSLARTRAKTPRDFVEGMKCVQACLRIIWECQMYQRERLAWWALENPVGYLRQFLGKPSYTFHPYEFGDRWSKRTDLWGYFTAPRKRPIELTPDEKYRCSRHTQFPVKDAIARAVTPPMFAKAFFKANP